MTGSVQASCSLSSFPPAIYSSRRCRAAGHAAGRHAVLPGQGACQLGCSLASFQPGMYVLVQPLPGRQQGVEGVASQGEVAPYGWHDGHRLLGSCYPVSHN